MEMISEDLKKVSDRLSAIETALNVLVHQKTAKEWYSTAEVAALLGKAEFTVREWCRLHRINAEKQSTGRGPHTAWVISRTELERFYREGLLPTGY